MYANYKKYIFTQNEAISIDQISVYLTDKIKKKYMINDIAPLNKSINSNETVYVVTNNFNIILDQNNIIVFFIDTFIFENLNINNKHTILFGLHKSKLLLKSNNNLYSQKLNIFNLKLKIDKFYDEKKIFSTSCFSDTGLSILSKDSSLKLKNCNLIDIKNLNINVIYIKYQKNIIIKNCKINGLLTVDNNSNLLMINNEINSKIIIDNTSATIYKNKINSNIQILRSTINMKNNLLENNIEICETNLFFDITILDNIKLLCITETNHNFCCSKLYY